MLDINAILAYLKQLTTIQWLVIGVGVYLLFPTIKTYWLKFVEAWNKPVVPAPTPVVPVPTPEPINPYSTLICQWEDLYNKCLEAGNDQACKKLQEVLKFLVKNPEKTVANPKK